ncbi:MAG: HAD family hydrolase [Myxococcota bacterium]|nr:HAD family hydrolase [Myxococcota bacterium]
MSSPPIRAVVFDLFDTLVDLELPRFAPTPPGQKPVHATALRIHEVLLEHVEVPFDTFADAMREVDRTHWKERTAEGLEFPTRERFGHLCRALGIEVEGLPERLATTHMAMLKSHVSGVPGHAEVLEELSQRVPLALCSNFTHSPTAFEVLAENGLTPHMKGPLVVSEDVGIRKPRREIFEAVLRGLGTRPEETLHVGDNIDADVGGAHALGMQTAWITRRVADPGEARERSSAPEPSHRIHSLRELLPIVGP